MEPEVASQTQNKEHMKFPNEPRLCPQDHIGGTWRRDGGRGGGRGSGVFGPEIAVGRTNQSTDTDTESRVIKMRGTGSSLFGSFLQQRARYLSKAGWWAGSRLHGGHWRKAAGFSAALLSTAGSDSRTGFLFCVFGGVQ